MLHCFTRISTLPLCDVPIFSESDFQYLDLGSRKPPVPSHTDRPQMGAKSTRNFVTANAVYNVMSVPRKPAAKYVDTAGGTTHDLEVSTIVAINPFLHTCTALITTIPIFALQKSGLVPKYTKKKVCIQINSLF